MDTKTRSTEADDDVDAIELPRLPWGLALVERLKELVVRVRTENGISDDEAVVLTQAGTCCDCDCEPK
jgi:hypothetical protein